MLVNPMAKENLTNSLTNFSSRCFSIHFPNVLAAKVVRKHGVVKGNIFFFVQWRGFLASQNTWEPEKYLTQKFVGEYFFESTHKHCAVNGVPQ